MKNKKLFVKKVILQISAEQLNQAFERMIDTLDELLYLIRRLK